MCGIAGFSGRFEQDVLERMSQAIAHRGPDDSGLLMVPEHGVGLAHRRLAIIDLSSRGPQPMADVSGPGPIVFHGGIHN